MLVPLSYSYRNLVVRWKTTLMTASGFVLVVAALVVMLAFANGIKEVCAVSGDPENVIVLRKGSNDEIFSQIDGTLASQIETAAGSTRRQADAPKASRELFMVINYPDPRSGDIVFLQLRGVLPAAFDVHRKVTILDGRRFRTGLPEIMIGSAVQRQFGIETGSRMRIGRRDWIVAGVFEAEGSTLETEAWCDLGTLASEFRREGSYNSIIVRTRSGQAGTRLVRQLNESRSIGVQAQTESDYYARQAEQALFIQTAAFVISWFMGVGAAFGVMNTMFAAIGQRRKDIAVMRIMGFQPHEILVSFLIESLLIAAVGGVLGFALGSMCQGLSQVTDLGGRQVQFAFRIDGQTVLIATVFTLTLGLLGGVLPAVSSMRVKPIEALR